LSESENNKEFSLSEGSLLPKEKVLGSNPAPSTKKEIAPAGIQLEILFA